jgi:hypothetical protein
MNVGVFVDQTYDIGRIEVTANRAGRPASGCGSRAFCQDVHFNPWYSVDTGFMSWQVTRGRAFVFGRSDWEYVFNTFAFACALTGSIVNCSGEGNALPCVLSSWVDGARWLWLPLC